MKFLNDINIVMWLLLAMIPALIITGCNGEDVPEGAVVLEGVFAFKGSQQAYVELPAIHYKFADRERMLLELDEQDRFRLILEPDSSKVAWIHYDDQSYPVFLKKGETISLHLDGADFPHQIEQSGGNEEANRRYQEYLKAVSDLEEKIADEQDNFRENPESRKPELYRDRIALAEEYLEDTPLELFVHRARGEYIVTRLEQVRHLRNLAEFDAEAKRQEILREAQEMGVFSLESLKAQRAGIRDITQAYAMSYGVSEELQEEYGEGLGAYELNRLAYDQLDSLRTVVLDYVDERDAEAHARMYLVAERIGEAPFEKAEPTYHQYVEEYGDYESYISFLENHYELVRSVQPGQPIVDFALEDPEGRTYTPEDFKGNHLLLTFWASWCANCMYQKGYLEEIYEAYSDKGFEVLTVSIEEDKGDWEAAVKQHNYPWVDVYAGGGFQSDLFMRYRAGSIPFYVLIDDEGIIKGVNNVRPSVDLEAVLVELME